MDSIAGAQIFPQHISSEVKISDDLNGLLPLLQRLDRLIQQAISALQSQSEAEPKLSWLEPTEILPLETSPVQVRTDSPLAWLKKQFCLSDFDLDLLTIALAPELDRQYVRIYAILQDDMSKKRPTVDLALNLLCSTFSEKLSQRKHFTTNSPLISHRLLHLFSEFQPQPVKLLEHSLILDDQVVRFLLQQPGLDFRLTDCCQLVQPNIFAHTLYSKLDVQQGLEALFIENWQQRQPLLLYFSGCDRISKRHTAENLAKILNVSLLVADVGKMLENKAKFEEKLQLILREAWFFHHLLYLDNFDLLYLQENQILDRTCHTNLAQNQGITILEGVEPWKTTATVGKGLITVAFNIPEASQRKDCWQTHLQAAQIYLEDRELDLLSDRFRLTPDQIADAVATASNHIRWRSLQTESNSNSSNEQSNHLETKEPPSSFLTLCSAARTQSSLDLGILAYKIEPKYTWDDIILRPNQLR